MIKQLAIGTALAAISLSTVAGGLYGETGIRGFGLDDGKSFKTPHLTLGYEFDHGLDISYTHYRDAEVSGVTLGITSFNVGYSFGQGKFQVTPGIMYSNTDAKYRGREESGKSTDAYLGLSFKLTPTFKVKGLMAEDTVGVSVAYMF